MSTIQEQLDKRATAIKQARIARADEYFAAYFELVKATALDQETDPDETVDVLANAGKSESDLHADAERYATRRKHADVLAERDARKAKLVATEAKLADKQAAFNAKVNEMRAELSGLEMQYAECLTAVAQADHAEKSLAQTAWPHIVRQEREILAQMRDIVERRGPLEDDIRSATGTLQQAERLVGDDGSEGLRDHNKQVAEYQRKRTQQGQKALDALEQQRLALDAELRQLHQAKMEP